MLSGRQVIRRIAIDHDRADRRLAGSGQADKGSAGSQLIMVGPAIVWLAVVRLTSDPSDRSRSLPARPWPARRLAATIRPTAAATVAPIAVDCARADGPSVWLLSAALGQVAVGSRRLGRRLGG